MQSSMPMPMPSELAVPEIWCPIPVRVHPESATAEERLLAWCLEHDLLRSEAAIERFKGCRYGTFVAYTYPDVVDLDLMCQWNAVNFLLDDLIDETAPADGLDLARGLLAQLTVGVPLPEAPKPASPLEAAQRDIWERAASRRSLDWQLRVVGHTRDWLASTVLQSTRHGADAIPSTEAFCRSRRLHSGQTMSLDYIEAGLDRELPADLANSDPYREMVAAVNDAIGWHNDAFSVEKELARGDYDLLPAVLAHNEKMPWPQAIARTGTMSEAATREFVGAAEDLRAMGPLFASAPGSIEDAITWYGAWLSGSLHWHRRSGRYSDVVVVAAGEMPAHIEPHLTAAA
ncbi:hypothetical protein AB8O64_07020 [Streptomyces sp. QH1-20]|uniref:terpene synthase family protein n=1 Tax=Streptomyces sp. QH1-20 TaxID=3240934 RepID=UPI003514DC34